MPLRVSFGSPTTNSSSKPSLKYSHGTADTWTGPGGTQGKGLG